MGHPTFDDVFRAGARFVPRRGAPFRIEVHPAGALALPSGRITLCDPVSAFDLDPLERAVPPGTYPVELAVAVFDADQRVAAARVRFAPGTPSRWVMATREGEQVEALPAGHLYGYGVDAGTGGFVDADAAAGLPARSDELSSALSASYRPTWSHAAAPGVVAFSSGWGDGFYGSYWGLADEGRPVVLCTDFGLCTEAVERRVVLELPAAPGPVEAPELAALGVSLTWIPATAPDARPLALEVASTRSFDITPVDATGGRAPVSLSITGSPRVYTFGREVVQGLRVAVEVLEDLVPIQVR
ncbi:MAG: DUF4241 domain-containing protein [Myxococcota bacterium]